MSLIWATKGLTAVLIVLGAVCADDGDDPAAGAAGDRAERHIFNSVRDGGGVCAGEQARQILWFFLYYERDRHCYRNQSGYGLIADTYSLSATMLIMGGATALILPVSLLLLTRPVQPVGMR